MIKADMKIEFFMPMVPPTATSQERKWRVVRGKPVSYEPARVKAAKVKLTGSLSGRLDVKEKGGACK